MDTNQTYTNNELTPMDAGRIRDSLTKDGFLILKAIYETSDIQHKALCTKLNKSPSNLSNMISKINKIEPELIVTSKNGNEKYYTLTTIAKQYIEQEKDTVGCSSGSHAFTDYKTTAVVTEALKTLELFKGKCGSDWRFTLFNLLNEKNTNINSGILEVYKELSDRLCKCRMQSEDALQQVLSLLEDPKLIELFTTHLDEKLFYFHLLEPLLALEKTNNITSFKMIDKIFSELHPLVFPPVQYEEPREPLLASEKYNNLLIGVMKLSAEFFNKRYLKKDAISTWKSAYFLSEEMAFYIAEKCSYLMALWVKLS